jgi:hypothetical protein
MNMNTFNSNDQRNALSENLESDSVSSFGFHFLSAGHPPRGQPGEWGCLWMLDTEQKLSDQQATGIHSFFLEMGTK